MTISVIVCSRDNVRFESVARQYAKAMGTAEYELVRISDATGLAEGYDRGLELSKGEIVVFSHDDIEFLTHGLAETLERHLTEFDIIGLAGTDRLSGPQWNSSGPPHIFGQVTHKVEGGLNVCMFGVPGRAVGGIQGLDGLFLAFRRPVIEKVGWDHRHFPGFHLYDLDCTYRAYQMGYRLGVVCDLPICHLSGGVWGDEWRAAAREFMRLHGHQLPPPNAYPWTFSSVTVRTKLEALSAMSPAYLTNSP